jgi:hypothetical protein
MKSVPFLKNKTVHVSQSGASAFLAGTFPNVHCVNKNLMAFSHISSQIIGASGGRVTVPDARDE